MAWKKLNEFADFWEKPVLGTEKQTDGKRYMALCVDPESENPYRGIAREVVAREGSPDVPGFLDRSKLIIVESYDLLNWEIVGDLKIRGIESIINKLMGDAKYKRKFIGLEDPDILVDEKGKRHVYFTIPFKYKIQKGLTYINESDVYVGHAEGNNLESLTATMPVLGRVDNEIVGFKEICPLPIFDNTGRFVLTEVFVHRGNERKYSAIGVSKAKNLSGKWDYIKLVHDPEKESRKWCAGHSSPCRIFNPDILNHKGYLVGIMNGREPTEEIDGKKYYKKFRPGLFLFDSKSSDIIWIDDEPLLEDPIATTITFASELVYLNKKEVILYAHPNDSFVRAYRLNIQKIKERLPDTM